MNKEDLERILRMPQRKVVNLTDRRAPEVIRIEDYAMSKAYAICDAVKTNFGASREWYGFLVSDNSDPEKIVDVFLERNSSNEAAYTKILGLAISEAAERAKASSKTVVGWIHSHGALPVFFSGTDKKNMQSVLNSVSVNTRRQVAYEEVLFDNLSVMLNGEFVDNKGGALVDLEGVASEIKSARILEPVYCGWSYSIVVNDERKHYQEISLLEEKILTKAEKSIDKETNLEILKTDKVVSNEEIMKEVTDKIGKKKFWQITPKSALSDQNLESSVRSFLTNLSRFEPEVEGLSACRLALNKEFEYVNIELGQNPEHNQKVVRRIANYATRDPYFKDLVLLAGREDIAPVTFLFKLESFLDSLL